MERWLEKISLQRYLHVCYVEIPAMQKGNAGLSGWPRLIYQETAERQ